MHATALVAQFPVSLSIQQNLGSVQRVLERARRSEAQRRKIYLWVGACLYKLDFSLVSERNNP